MTDASGARRIVLLGMMGSGKSSIGTALNRRTGWPFIDNDALVEQATGRTARELLARQGEAAMREAESAALRTAMTLSPPIIVATAAGTILDPVNRDLLRAGGFVVWLRASAEVLADRAAGAAHRPWLEDDPVAWFRQAHTRRDPLYADVADLEIDTERVDAAAAADRILDAIGFPSADTIRP